MVTTDSEDYQFSAAAPLAASGLDIDGLLSGDPATLAQAKSMGLPLPTGPSPSGGANPAVGSNASSPAGTAAMQPQAQPSKPPNAIMPSGKPATVPSSMDGMGAALARAAQPPPPAVAQAAQAPNAIVPGGAPAAVPPSSMDSMGASLAQSQDPATNSPAAPGESSASPTVPATVSPSGLPTSPLAQAFSSAQQTENKIGAMPTESDTLKPYEDTKAKLMSPQSAANPTGIPSPYSPQYRPTAGRRILRGLAAVGEGVARGGIRGGLLGGLDPEAVGATPYSAPNRTFKAANAVNAQAQALNTSQEATAEKSYTADTSRLKDLLTSQADLTKAAAAGETVEIKNKMADIANEIAVIRGRQADASQARADATQTRADAAVVAANAQKERADKAANRSGAAPSTRHREAQVKTLTPAEEINLEKTKNKAIDAAQATLDSRGATPNQWAVKRAQQAFQTAQNEWEQAHGITEDDPAHVTVGDDLVWTRGGAPLPKAEQRAGAQPQAAQTPAAAKPPRTANKPKPPTPTAPAPQGAVDMALGTDNQYHYRDAGKKDLGVVK